MILLSNLSRCKQVACGTWLETIETEGVSL